MRLFPRVFFGFSAIQIISPVILFRERKRFYQHSSAHHGVLRGTTGAETHGGSGQEDRVGRQDGSVGPVREAPRPSWRRPSSSTARPRIFLNWPKIGPTRRSASRRPPDSTTDPATTWRPVKSSTTPATVSANSSPSTVWSAWRRPWRSRRRWENLRWRPKHWWEWLFRSYS